MSSEGPPQMGVPLLPIKPLSELEQDEANTCFADCAIAWQNWLEVEEGGTKNLNYHKVNETVHAALWGDFHKLQKRHGRVQLTISEMNRSNLSAAIFQDVNFAELPDGLIANGACFRRCTLRGEYMGQAELNEASFYACELSDANFVLSKAHESIWDNCLMHEVSFRRAKLNKSRFQALDHPIDCDFDRADLTDAVIASTDLAQSSFENSTCRNAIFYGSDLSGCHLDGADLSGADLRTNGNIPLNGNRVVNTRFHANAQDKWSVLRKTYTGPMFLINLLFVAAYFLPLIAQAVTYNAVSAIQFGTIDELQKLPDWNTYETCGGDPSKGQEPNVIHVEHPEHGNLQIACEEQSVWFFLLGGSGPFGPIMIVLTLILVVYNVFRAFLTWQIELTRSAVERSGVSPSLYEPFSFMRLVNIDVGYPRLYAAHRILEYVRLGAIAALAARAIETLFFTEVIVLGS